MLSDRGAFAPSLSEMLDRAIAQHQLPPTVVVAVDGSSKFGCSQYINSSWIGPHMDHFDQEVIPTVESFLGLRVNQDQRMIMGHSSGGFGAMVFAMLRPSRISHVVSFAGDCWYEHMYRQMIPTCISVNEKYKSLSAFVEAFFSRPNPMSQSSSAEIETMMLMNMCQCYAPNPDVPTLFCDLFFDLHTGELNPKIWEKFLAWDPLLMVDQYKENVRTLKTFSLRAGSRDQYGLQLGHRQIAKKLTSHGIHHELIEFDANHGGYYFRFFDAIQDVFSSL
ncbi:MAG: alpha/beta hydrolase-fold protein [Bdellovibrionota bacterium]